MKSGIKKKKTGFYQYSATWDFKYKATLRDSKSAAYYSTDAGLREIPVIKDETY